MSEYARWLVSSGIFKKVTYHYMIAGHTKFSPDRMFGRISTRLKKVQLEDTDQLVNLVNEIDPDTINAVYIQPNSGFMLDWESGLAAQKKKIQKIKSCHWLQWKEVDENVICRAKTGHNEPWIEFMSAPSPSECLECLPLPRVRLDESKIKALKKQLKYCTRTLLLQ